MNTESISPGNLKNILRTDHHVVFFPKRQFEIPQVKDETVTNSFGEKNLKPVMNIVKRLFKYLDGQPVGDNWGKNHEERRKWRTKMTLEYGSTFLEVYQDRNQFRVNNLSLVRFSIDHLRDLAEMSDNTNLSRLLSKIYTEIDIKLNGEDPETKRKIGQAYSELETLQDKLEVVHFFEDKILEVLEMLT